MNPFKDNNLNGTVKGMTPKSKHNFNAQIRDILFIRVIPPFKKFFHYIFIGDSQSYIIS